ncbi:hypothetical protein, partial [Mycoplasma phocimorsus]|uniref:hypothetical protein n=1 Tax=Mycoplasma phocimorsus TaxID=3045839 RepID=UPI0024C066EA
KSKDKIWKIEQYEAQKKEEFAQRNFKDLVGWLFAMFYQNEKDEGGIQKTIDEYGKESSINKKEVALLWSWRYGLSEEEKIARYKEKKKRWDEKGDAKEFFKKNDEYQKSPKATLVRWRFEDITWDESRSLNPRKKEKWETIKSIVAKNGLFAAVIKIIKLFKDWEDQTPNKRAQELIKITVEATASIARIVKNLKKK